MKRADLDEDQVALREPHVELEEASRWQIFPGDVDVTLGWEPETDLTLLPVDDEVCSHTLISDSGPVRVIREGERWAGITGEIDAEGRVRPMPVVHPITPDGRHFVVRGFWRFVALQASSATRRGPFPIRPRRAVADTSLVGRPCLRLVLVGEMERDRRQEIRPRHRRRDLGLVIRLRG